MGSPRLSASTLPSSEPATIPLDRDVPEATLGGRDWALYGLSALLLGTLILRLTLWARAEGFEQGDPVEYVNIAYRIAFGIGIPWWDLRPLLLPLLYVPVLYLGQLWPDPSGEALVRMLRLVSVAFGVGSVGLVYLIGRCLGGTGVGLVSGVLLAANPLFNRLSVSTFAEVPSTFFVLLALWLLLEPGRRRALLGGLALGAACMMRYQVMAFIPAVGVWLLARGRWTTDDRRPLSGASVGGRPPSIVSFVLGLSIAALAQACIEMVAYGRPFHSLVVSFEYNVTSGLAPAEFGSEPFSWFLVQAPAWLGHGPLVLAACGLPVMVWGPSASGWRLVGLAALSMFLFLSALPHKETRFMAPVVPLLTLFAGHGLIRLSVWLWSRIRDARFGETMARHADTPLPRAAWLAAGALTVVAAAPLLRETAQLDLRANVAYVDGPKRAVELKPGAVMGTIPWFVPRPYTGSRLELVRMDRKVWDDREYVTRTVENSDFLLFPEYWLLEDRDVRRLVDAGYRTLESYSDGVVLLQNKRLDEPPRRRQP